MIVYGGFGRIHMFQAVNFDEIKQKLLDSASTNVGISIKVLSVPLTLQDFQIQRFGKYRSVILSTVCHEFIYLNFYFCCSDDEYQTSVSEFMVYKINQNRHKEPVRRTLCLSEMCLLERDPQTYNVCTLRPFSDIFAFVRDNDNPQHFSIEYLNGEVRTYTATER